MFLKTFRVPKSPAFSKHFGKDFCQKTTGLGVAPKSLWLWLTASCVMKNLWILGIPSGWPWRTPLKKDLIVLCHQFMEPEPQGQAFINGWKWWFPTIFYIKIWFIIQLKHPFIYKWLFRVPGLNHHVPINSSWLYPKNVNHFTSKENSIIDNHNQPTTTNQPTNPT